MSFAGPRRSCSRAEEDRSYEFHGELGSQVSGLDGSGVLERGSEEKAKGRGERITGVFVVLLHTRVGVLGYCCEPATTAARWRPAVISGARGKAMEAPARGIEGSGGTGATRGRPQQAGCGSGALLRRRSAWFSAGGEKQKSR